MSNLPTEIFDASGKRIYIYEIYGYEHSSYYYCYEKISEESIKKDIEIYNKTHKEYMNKIYNCYNEMSDAGKTSDEIEIATDKIEEEYKDIIYTSAEDIVSKKYNLQRISLDNFLTAQISENIPREGGCMGDDITPEESKSE